MASSATPEGKATSAKEIAADADIEQVSSRNYPLSFEQDAGILSRIFFFFLNPIFEKGFREPLELQDLGPPSSDDRCRNLYKAFMQEYREIEALKPRKNQSLWFTLWRTVGYRKLWWAIFLYAMYSAQQFGPVLILAAIVRHLEGIERLSAAELWIFVALMLLLPVIGSVLVAHSNAILAHVGVQFRNTLINVIYRKALRLSPAARAMTSTGQIVNMFSAETLQIQRFMFFVNNLIIAPFQIAVALVLVYLLLGIATFVGLALIILILPSNGWVFDWLREVRKRKAKVTDRRVKLMNEILNGIRIIKYYAWERAFQERVMEIRQKEVRLLRELAYIVACAFTLVLQAVPVFMPVLTFYTFVALGNQLDAATAFTAISLFNLLQFPFVFLPLGYSQYNQTRVACDRILDLLAAEELDDYVDRDPISASVGDNSRDTVICMEGAFLGWGLDTTNSVDNSGNVGKNSAEYINLDTNDDGAEETKKVISGYIEEGDVKPINRSINTLIDVSFRVQRGQLLAVVGGVGSGKSSLLTGLLGEMILSKGQVRMAGSVAYCDQRPWILNDTVINNVLFGMPYDQDRFDRALHASNLEEDISVLPGGVNTQIGERGINLSGGQKARVALARAIYREADIYLLDDPLSAVDAHVGQLLFEEGICNTLKGTTRILVTHQVQLLPKCDLVLVLDAGRVKGFGSYDELVQAGMNFAAFVPQETKEKETTIKDEEGVSRKDGDMQQKPAISDRVTSKEDNLFVSSSEESDDQHFAVNSPTSTLGENMKKVEGDKPNSTEGHQNRAGPRSFFSFYSDTDEVGRSVKDAIPTSQSENDGNPGERKAIAIDGEVTLSEHAMQQHQNQPQQLPFRRNPSFRQRGRGGHNQSRQSVATTEGSNYSLDAALMAGDKLIARGKFVDGDIDGDVDNLETIHFSGGSEDGDDQLRDREKIENAQLEIEGISRKELKQRINCGLYNGGRQTESVEPPGASIGISELNEPMDVPEYPAASGGEGAIEEDAEYLLNNPSPSAHPKKNQGNDEHAFGSDDRGYSKGVVSFTPTIISGTRELKAGEGDSNLNEELRRQQSQSIALRSNEGRFDLEEAYRMHRQKSAQLAELRRKDSRSTTINTTEEIAAGNINFATYYYYFKAGGLILCMLLILFIVANQAFLLLSSYWLAYWGDVSVSKEENGEPLSTSRNIYFLNIFAALSCLNIIAYLFRSLVLANIRLNASIVLQEGLLNATLGATVAFFDVTPVGRVLNRFSSDMNSIDEELSQTLSQFTNSIAQIVGAVAAISGATYGTFLPLVVPLTYFYDKVQKYFRATSTRIARLESVSRSPIYADFSQALQGANTIRAYNDIARFVNGLENAVDSNSSANVMQQLLQQWLTIRLDMIGGIVSCFVALLAVATASQGFLPAGFVALGLSYSFQLTTYLKFAVRVLGQAEAQMNSVERVKYYMDHIEQEADSHLANSRSSRRDSMYRRVSSESDGVLSEAEIDESWPENGVIEGNNVQLRYRDGPLVLKGIDFKVAGGEKIGIAGRTGSGKSSLMVGLFRIHELAGGSITIDNLDISRVPLHILRSKLGIIPQDPVMFSASVRFNLDPFDQHTDARIMEVLDRLDMKDHIMSLPDKLQELVAEGGDNFSAGQRQLICIARAILRNPKILILDEATASIDNETDSIVQKTVRDQFKNSTVLTIAHRLNTIIDSDKIMVLHDGKLEEIDSPQKLLEKPDGAFRSLWNKHLQSHGQEEQEEGQE